MEMPARKLPHVEVDAVDDVLDVEQQDQAEDHEHELGDQVRKREHEVDGTRFLDADHVYNDQQKDQHDGPEHVGRLVPGQRLEDAHIAAEEAQVADREVRRDGYGRRVVEQLHPADDEADRRVKGTAREARAAARMGQGRRALGVVEGRGDEDEPGEDQRNRSQA